LLNIIIFEGEILAIITGVILSEISNSYSFIFLLFLSIIKIKIEVLIVLLNI
jgi:hypothetical protein